MLKYSANPDRYGSHEQILAMLRELPAGSAVLDVGSARGYIGERLRGNGYYLAGIEQDPQSAEAAARFYDEFVVSNIESGKLKFARKFEAIVLADILEHLQHPLRALMALREHLSSTGKFIISVPNVANIYVRLNLLLGKFDYADRGILDETHLRFFTRKSISKLMQQARLRITDFVVTPLPLPLVFPATREGSPCHFVHRANWGLTKAWKTLLAYQFILTAVQAGE